LQGGPPQQAALLVHPLALYCATGQVLAAVYPQQQHGFIYICIVVMAISVLNTPTP